MSNDQFVSNLGKLLIALVAVVVVLWFTFKVVFPILAWATSVILVVGILSLLGWIVYKVMTTDPDALAK